MKWPRALCAPPPPPPPGVNRVNGYIIELFDEAQTLQNGLSTTTRKQDITIISRQFRDHMQRGDVNKAITVVTNNMAGGILPLNEETLNSLMQKHPEASKINEETLLSGPFKTHEISCI